MIDIDIIYVSYGFKLLTYSRAFRFVRAHFAYGGAEKQEQKAVFSERLP